MQWVRDRTRPSGRAPAASPVPTGLWQLDPARSTIGFEVPHYWGLGTVHGRFTRYAGTLNLDARPAIELTIDAGSVDTGNARRDQHLRSADFFAAADHPYIRFTSTVARLDGDALAVTGKLSARGREMEVELDATIAGAGAGADAGAGVSLRAEVFVMHRALGITWNPFGFTRPYCKLIVSGPLTAVAAELPEPRTSGLGRRPARGRPARVPTTYGRCQR